MTSLADTILFSSLEDVKKKIEQDPSEINVIDEYGFTPLIEAIIANKFDVAELLIEYGADVQEPDINYATPLYWAVENNRLNFVKLLLEKKADPNAYNRAHQPILVKAVLRDQTVMKKLLYQYGADLNFAQDYINTKLLGHRFELAEQVDIVTPKGKFIELEFSGFFLEFTLGIVTYSLRQFLNNFAARDFRPYFKYLIKILETLNNANQLIHYQEYLLDFEKYDRQIKTLLKKDPLIIPIGYEGHAICFVKFGNWLAKCDRGANSKKEGSVNIYEINNINAFTPDLIKNLVFKRQSEAIIHHEINKFLNLKKLGELPVPSQVIGNCAWANVEATLPTLLFMSLIRDPDFGHAEDAVNITLNFYHSWQTWDKDIALNECIQSFWLANPARKASKAALLAAILFQTCTKDDPINQSRAKRILRVLTVSNYEYILKSYLKIYKKKHNTIKGQQLLNWLYHNDISVHNYLEN